LKILAIDTTSEQGSIALVDDQRVVEEVVLHSPDGFAHVLFGEIDKLLERQGIKLGAIDRFASASGPGTFTGVRVGLTAAKGLGEACKRPVCAVSNLKALAWFGTKTLRAPWIDARRGEIYGAVYDASLRLVQQEVVMNYDAWIQSLPGDCEMITSGKALAGAIGIIASREECADIALVDANYVRRSDAELLWKD
jgi:tRNA threonylcarbamoyladenosine biosynthesis protein TsaB